MYTLPAARLTAQAPAPSAEFEPEKFCNCSAAQQLRLFDLWGKEGCGGGRLRTQLVASCGGIIIGATSSTSGAAAFPLSGTQSSCLRIVLHIVQAA